MKVERFIELTGVEFFTGVPDSLLKPVCDYLTDKYTENGKKHIIAANEGNAVGIAAGYYLATGRIPLVYMQNSGEGNAINPIASLLSNKVYSIPCIFVIGWRGEPGTYDEPQHVFQGEITLDLLKVMNVSYFIVDQTTGEEELRNIMILFRNNLSCGKQVAFVIKKNALEYKKQVNYCNGYSITREEAIRCIVEAAGTDLIISTTGKSSRELFEIREQRGEGHGRDFLTVGSMGHSSSIALGISINSPENRIWCIDGDGAAIMHMGAMGIIGSVHPENLVHIVINNASHESVGGMPTAGKTMDFCNIARSCGYKKILSITSGELLKQELNRVKEIKGLTFVEIKCTVGARPDLGRPTTTTMENIDAFMKSLRENKKGIYEKG